MRPFALCRRRLKPIIRRKPRQSRAVNVDEFMSLVDDVAGLLQFGEEEDDRAFSCSDHQHGSSSLCVQLFGANIEV